MLHITTQTHRKARKLCYSLASVAVVNRTLSGVVACLLRTQRRHYRTDCIGGVALSEVLQFWNSTVSLLRTFH